MVELLPLALVITLSPLSIIPAVLVMHSPHPRAASLAYLGGWLVGLSVLTALAIGISGRLGGLRQSPPHWAAWLRITVGTALIVFAVIRWLTRHGHDHLPAWTRTLTSVTPSRAAVLGVTITVVNVKVLLICAAAGLAIGADALGISGTVLSAALFVGIAASSVAIPVLAYVAAGERADAPLERLKAWLERHNAALVAAILLLIGLVMLSKGIRHL
jgi:threonine/homoserine/homoserine lactone efflux protein